VTAGSDRRAAPIAKREEGAYCPDEAAEQRRPRGWIGDPDRHQAGGEVLGSAVVSFFKRLFSADYRAAITAEAAGNVDLAAERYGLAGDRAAAVRMHLARAARAGDRGTEIGALHDALHWAGDDPALIRAASAALGKALYARAVAEGIATARDRERIREAARLLAAGAEHAIAGEAYEKIGDHQAAAAAYSAAGMVDKVEAALAADEELSRRDHDRREAFADYELHVQLGRRDDARADLQRCIAAGGEAGEYRRLLDQLESNLITGGRMQLQRRRGGVVVVCAAPVVAIGRDGLCDLVLRTGGVSRRHAEVEVGVDGFMLRDAGSRNGTAIGGLPIAGRVPLRGSGAFDLADDCRIEFETHGAPEQLSLHVANGVDRGVRLIAAADGARIDLSRGGIAADVVFAEGRPWLGVGTAGALMFNGEPLRAGRVQLIRGDELVVDGEEIDVQ
jgi:tetratricopeptide (TPR) repeat protein